MKDIEIFHQEINILVKEKRRPTLFLHACCGPCLTYPFSELIKYFQVTIGFFNPNIYPIEEYNKRYDTLLYFVNEYCKKNKVDRVDVVLNTDNYEKYQTLFKERENDVEGGNTCVKCHAYRMNLAYEYASKHNFEYFTTVMSVSCKKPSHILNEIGINLSKKYQNTKYLIADFKKENGQLKGIQLSKEYHLYRQNYCGCMYSLREREEKK